VVLEQLTRSWIRVERPLFEAIGVIGVINPVANFACPLLVWPYRHGDINMASAFECSRNDEAEGFAFLAAACRAVLYDRPFPSAQWITLPRHFAGP